MTTTLIAQDQIRELHRVAVSKNLDRNGLLAEIDPSVTASLPHGASSTAQLLLDLGALNRIEKLRDGSVPLLTWIENGVSLLGNQAEAEVFERHLAALERSLGGKGASKMKGPAPGPTKESRERRVILFLSANPSGPTKLALDEEEREIDQALRGTTYSNDLRLEKGAAARPTDITELMLRHTPDIVHFSGHGSTAGELWFVNDAGEIAPVQPSTLGRMFGALGDRPVRGVVLDACYSDKQADKIIEHVQFVIGMSTAIKDASARKFAGTFYQALAFGRSLQTAFDLACTQIDLAGLDEANVPRLRVRDGLRAKEIYLLGR